MSAAMAFWRLPLVPLTPFVFLLPSASGKVPFARSTFSCETPRRIGGVSAPTPAPVLRRQHFRRGEETCGVLEGGYTDALPVCSGSASYCTFTSSSGYQGCCRDESLDSCTFYTTCYAYSDQASCTGSCTSSGLVCPSSAPECTQYTYQWEPNPTASSWTGFACGSQQASIYAFALNGIDQPQTPATASSTPSTSSGLSSSPSSSSSGSITTASSTTKSSKLQSSSSLTLLPPPTGSSSTTSTATPTAATTSPVTDASVSQPHKDTGVIAGGVVGGIAALILLLGLLIFFRVHRKRKERSRMVPALEISRPWRTW